MPIDFPIPTFVGETFSAGGKTWIWNGYAWDAATITAVGATGATGVQGATGIGATGEVGPQGATGVVGATGITGATGATGSTGATGIEGATGIQGATGDIGSTGATGVQGATGEIGATGASGVEGDRYHTTSNTVLDIVSTGTITLTTDDLNLDYSIEQSVIVAYSAGQHMHGRVSSYNPGTGVLVLNVTDSAGSGTGLSPWQVNLDGAVGVQGATGATGVQGATGADGATGATGDNGATGAQGATGEVGSTGATGVIGATGSIGATGEVGPQGSTGPIGATGVAGATGDQGSTGATGPIGATGIGSPGSAGATGATGLTGATGVGSAGATGASGATGVAGSQGATGATGPTADLSGYVLKAGDTMTGKLIAAADATASKLNIGGTIVGSAPASFSSGDLWINSNSKFSWGIGSSTYQAAAVNQNNTFVLPQTISVSSASNLLTVNNTNATGGAAVFNAQGTSPAVRITQTGSGEAFRVEDSTTPDATAFVISADGRVGIGANPDSTVSLSVDTTGIKFGDGTIQTTATAIGATGATGIGSIGATGATGAVPANVVTTDTTQSITGTKTISSPVIENGTFNNGYIEESSSATISSSTYTIDLANGTVQLLTLSNASITFTFPTATSGRSFLATLKQDATGSRAVTWPASVKWAGGTTPTLTSTASKSDVFSFTCIDGVSWIGVVVGQNYTI